MGRRGGDVQVSVWKERNSMARTTCSSVSSAELTPTLPFSRIRLTKGNK